MSSHSRYVIWAQEAAAKYGVPVNYFMRQITQESGWNPNARSPAGAIGIAQFMPGTARGMGINPSNPHDALFAAARMDRQAYNKYHSWAMAFAAYNAGGGNVDKYGGVPPFAETQHYVAVIMGGGPGTVTEPHYGGYHPGRAGSTTPVPTDVNQGPVTQRVPRQVRPKIVVKPPRETTIPLPNANVSLQGANEVYQLPGFGPGPAMQNPYVAPYKQAASTWQQIASQPGVSPETVLYAKNAQVVAGANPNA